MLELLQIIFGFALFFGCGYSISLFLFPKEIDDIERITLSLVFSVIFPTLTILFTNMVLGIPINTISVYITYITLTVLPYLGSKEPYRSKLSKLFIKLNNKLPKI